MKKTKIVCTIGPASRDEAVLEKMALAGMNVARLNFSHGTYDEHRETIQRIKRVREKLNIPLPIMLDSKGPEYRIKTFKDGKVNLKEGDKFIFTADDVDGDETKVSVSYPHLADELSPKDIILLNNGLMKFEVEKICGKDIHTRVVIGGELSNRKSMAFPDKVLKQEYLSEQDKKDFLFGIENDVDFIACSFVSCAEELLKVRKFLKDNGSTDIDLIAKIENRAGVNDIENIINASDGIMIGRGDMGVEIPFEELPFIQKHLIQKCRLLGKRVITATEMLESMIHNPRPTRAEISDVANAVYDGTSAIMLSGETAMGSYPVETVATMSKIASETENHIDFAKRLLNTEFTIKNTVDAVSHSSCIVAMDIKAKAIVVCTKTGGTGRMVSRFRPPMPIIGMTTDVKVWRKLALSWGVTPVMTEVFTSTDVLFYEAARTARESKLVSKGELIVITAGAPININETNLIKVEKI